MTRLPASQLSEAFDRVIHEGERVLLEKDGRPVAALISLEDLEFLEALEDAADVDAARTALAEPGENIPWERFKAERDL
jgi:PHD/YefM family antitoxin component YafN of YafNO toxin-antitoxin module